MFRSLSFTWALLAFASGLCTPAYAARTPPVRLSKTISLPGIEGGFDHLAFDAARHRFFLAAEDHGTVEVFESRSRKFLSLGSRL
jgi:hypothetical protein